MNKLLDLLAKDATLTVAELARMTNIAEADVKAAIDEWEKAGVILARQTVIDRDRAGMETVSAIIEIKIDRRSPFAYDRLAQRIRSYPEVKSLYLMSGAFDFAVIVEGASLKEVAHFVGQKLASHENVISASTHFMLTTYKEGGVVFGGPQEDEREKTII